MAGTLKDLSILTDVPRSAVSPPSGPTASPGTAAFVARCRDLADRAPWAEATLSGIAKTAELRGGVSPAQLRAVNNIEEAAERKQDRPFRHPRNREWQGPPAVRPGHCRRCRRLLTDPESIKLGIGPECRELEAAGE